MNTIILLTILGAIIGVIVMWVENGIDGGFFLFGIVPGGFIGAIIGFIISLSLPCKYITTTWENNLESLQDNNSISGSFVLGCGRIDGEMRYVFYKINDDSTYQMSQLDYRDCLIRYTTGKPKIIITDTREDETKAINKWAIDLASESKQTYIFEVPKGAIKNNFQLDAQ